MTPRSTTPQAAVSWSGVVFLRRSNPRHQDTVGAEAHENAWLILPEEAPELALSAEEWDQTVGGTRGPSLGPRVSVIKPTIEERQQGPTITATSPLSLEVQFEENRAPIDMTSLTVSARRKSFPPVKVNLTERIQRYVKGWAIFASGISIPKGKYLIELVIADEEGHETVEAFRLEVHPAGENKGQPGVCCLRSSEHHREIRRDHEENSLGDQFLGGGDRANGQCRADQ